MINENINQAPQTEENLNELRKIRFEKLADLQSKGKDPFLITKYDRLITLLK